MVRCNRCGNENPTEAFVCAFCSAKLKFEKIERIRYFERPEKKWKRPQGILRRYLQVFTNPSELFWDLRYDEKRRGAGYIFLIIVGNALNLLLLLILLPVVYYSGTNVYGDLAPLFLSQPVWQIVGIITLVIYCGWIPLLAGLCIRSLHEISTSRSLVACYIIGIISGVIIFLTSGVFIPSAVP